jgi:hypothetical protein
MSGINYLINRLHTYPISEEIKDIEMNKIKYILHSNEYNTNTQKKLKQKQSPHTDTQNQETNLVTFTYNGKETRKMTEVSRDTKLKIAYTIQNILKPQPKTQKYNKYGIYQMKCRNCPFEYIGQTGRTFNTRYKERIYNIKCNNSYIGYSNPILDTEHTYDTIQNTMDIIRIDQKGKYITHEKNITYTKLIK